MTRILVVSTTFPQYPGDPRGEFIRRHWELAADAGARPRILVPWTAWCHGDLGGRCEIARFGYAPRRVSTLTGRFGMLENIRENPWRAALVAPLWVALTRAVRGELARSPADLVVAHMLLPAGWIVADHCARVGQKFELFGHGTDVDLLLRLPQPLQQRFAANIRRAEAVRFPSAEKRERFRAGLGLAADPVPLVVDPMIHCVDTPVPHSGPRGPGPPRLLFMGRLIPQKGVVDLLEAVSGLQPRPSLYIAGDGPLRGALQRRARALGVDARFFGFVEGAAKQALWAAADLVCVPSREIAGLSEGAPLVVREALSRGLPVVATSVGGIPELGTPADGLCLVRAGDLVGLRGALQERLANLTHASHKPLGSELVVDILPRCVTRSNHLPTGVHHGCHALESR